nr:hypothetical protein Iba_chr05aCG6920 [Ipomoea batatas]
MTSSLTLSSPNTDAQFSSGAARHLSLLPAWRSTSASTDDQRRRRADCSSSPLASCHTQALSINQSSSFLQAGYSESRSAKMDWFEYRMPEAMMAPVPLDEVMTLKFTRTLRAREEAGQSMRPLTTPQVPHARPPTPSSSSTSPIVSPRRPTPSSSPAMPPPSLVSSLCTSISSTPVVLPPNDSAPSSLSPFPEVPVNFIKVTD